MVRTAGAAEDGPRRLRSDGLSPAEGFLGDFTRGPALFSVYDLGADQSGYPNGPNRYLIDVEDGVGARECCRFTDDPEDEPAWRGAWNNDPWCPWILKHAKAQFPRSG
ncbi:hypothetical protein [Glycomyces sp. YM15]|uniref:hypothetical protein n=1 Tax=Glycomyces sp. YM15 TaxID=2800446 RepID=UPI0019622F73|nr:hypothetical protein [Glycomyces sp. YM15]